MANNSMLMPLKIERQFSGALDANYEFDTLDELKNYAITSALSYPGQILYCVEEDTLYKVNNDKTDVASLGGGGGSDSGEENKIDSISINGSPITPDENKNVDITVPTVTNDLTDELKSSYDDAVTTKHTHENGTVLDGITAEKVEAWDKADENVQSDWNETDNTANSFIKNKPEIPAKVSDLTNDSNYQTADDVTATLAPYAKSEDVSNITTSLDNKVDKTALEDIQASGVKISKSDGTKKSLQGMYEGGELGGGVEIDDSKASSDTTYSSSKIVELTSKYAMSFNSSTGKLSITLK